jgi:hypothetical protein
MVTTIQRISRDEAVTERAVLISRMRERFGTDDRDELRDLSFSGAMDTDEIDSLERLRTLDFLLSD